MEFSAFLRAAAVGLSVIDCFLDPEASVWARFDPELGYLLRNYRMRDGQDGAFTVNRFTQTGERLMLNFADRPCRINTYGNSFTQCHQVSDGETWQEAPPPAYVRDGGRIGFENYLPG